MKSQTGSASQLAGAEIVRHLQILTGDSCQNCAPTVSKWRTQLADFL